PKPQDYTVARRGGPMRHYARAFPIAHAIVTAAAVAALRARDRTRTSPAGNTSEWRRAHRHPEAAKMTNPVRPDATSIAAGKSLYDKHCAGCHGDSGRGDGAMGAELNPKPPDLTDAEWKHGSSRGARFR